MKFTLTLSWPVIVIVAFVLATQTWAWTRDSSSSGGYDLGSARFWAVFFMTCLDAFFIAVVGGIFIW